jgi:hypothetical protein
MSARVFILGRHGGEDGPYTEEEVLDALQAGDLSPLDWCRLEDQPQAQMLGEVFERVPPEDADGSDDAEPIATPAEPPAGSPLRPSPSVTEPRPPRRGDHAGEDREERDEDDVELDAAEADEEERERAGESEEEEAAGEVGGDEGDEEEMVYFGSPSWLGYGWPLMVAGAVLAAGYWLGQFGVKWVVGALAVALVLVVRLLLHRAAREYVVTTDRVEATLGLLAKTTRQIPLRELGSIRLHRPWPLGWLGVGTIIFSSDGGSGDDVIFERVGRVQRVIALVRDQQRRAGRR